MSFFSSSRSPKSSPQLLPRLIILFFLLIAVSALSVTVFLYAEGYDHFCHILLERMGKLHKEAEFKEQFLTSSRFQLIKIILIIFSCCCFFLIRKREWITDCIRGFRQLIKEQFTFIAGLKSFHKNLLLAILLIQFLLFGYCILQFPISYDEAWTWLNFTSKSVFTSASYYPAPNNHIFFSILTNIFHVLPFHDPKISMRLINLCCSIITSILFFKLMLKFYSAEIALYTLALFIFSYPVALYSIQARGYELVLLLSLMAVYATINYFSNTRKRYSYICIISTALGFYTMPSFLYFFVSFNAFIFIYLLSAKKPGIVRAFIIMDIISIAITVLLYIPVILISGLSSITHNQYVKSIPFAEVISRLPAHFSQTANWFLGISQGGIYIIIALILFVFVTLLRKKDYLFMSFRPEGEIFPKKDFSPLQGFEMITKYDLLKWPFYFLVLLLLIFPPFILLAHRVIPFERTWIYLAVPIAAMMAFLIKETGLRFFSGKQLPPTAFGALTFLTITLLFYSFNINYKAAHTIDYESEAFFSGKSWTKNVHSIVSSEVLSSDLLTYEIQRLDNHQVNVGHIYDHEAVTADAIIFHNDSIRSIPNIGEYTLIGKNDFITFYLKK